MNFRQKADEKIFVKWQWFGGLACDLHDLYESSRAAGHVRPGGQIMNYSPGTLW